jgi:glycerol-3-phosphate dehydrogenase (NAD(P)+)
MKGIELGTSKRMTEVIAEMTGATPERLVAVSGPNLAREIMERQPAATVVACADEAVATLVQGACHSPTFRPYTSTDVVGAELAGAVKNVIAIATGMADGLGYGENAKAAVITRGLAETVRLGLAQGAQLTTFLGLAGLGDLVATCMSPLSRNRTFGERMGRGETVEQIAGTTRQVAEGVKSCESILALAEQHGVEMPIVESVVHVVRGDLTGHDMITRLLSRDPKPEFRHS